MKLDEVSPHMIKLKQVLKNRYFIEHPYANGGKIFHAIDEVLEPKWKMTQISDLDWESNLLPSGLCLTSVLKLGKNNSRLIETVVPFITELLTGLVHKKLLNDLS